MDGHFLPLLLGVIIQLQYHTGHAQFLEPYQSQSDVYTSFNTPISSISPYQKFNGGGEKGFPAVDQSAFNQPFSSGVGQLPYTTHDGRLAVQQPQQQFVGGGQSTSLRQQPSSIGYYSVVPDTKTVPSVQQFQRPNFVYKLQNQGQLSQNVDTSSGPIQTEFVYPVGGVPQSSVRHSSQIQLTPNFAFMAQPASQPTSSIEEYLPITNIRTSLPEESKIVTIGDSPFVITAIKPKSTPSVQVVPSGRNPLESLRSEAIIEYLNKEKRDGVRTNQVIVQTRSDNGRISVPQDQPPLITTTIPPVTEQTTEPPPSPAPTVSVTPTEKVIPLSPTTPLPLPPTTTTTTTPPPPPSHLEVTTIEERHYLSRKKKITVFIRVEDAGFDAEEKENYATKQDFYEWTKTIIEPTDIYDEKKTFLRNETREVDGPSTGVEVTQKICRNFIDDKEFVVEPDLLSAPCPRPEMIEGGSWEEKAYHRIDSEIDKKLKDIFNVTKIYSRPTTSDTNVQRTSDTPTVSSGFLQQTLKTIEDVEKKLGDFKNNRDEWHNNSPHTSKRDTEKPRHVIKDHDLADATEVTSTDTTTYHDNVFKGTPNQTSKRETKPEIVDDVKKQKVKTDEVKMAEVIIETTLPTTESHIMLITRTPPARPPNPYHHHPTTTALPPTKILPTKTASLPKPEALLRSSVETVPSSLEENKEIKFFRRST